MLKRLKPSGGGIIEQNITRLSTILILFLVIIYNFTDQIIKGQNLLERWTYTVPFIFFLFLFLIIKKPILNTIFLFFVGFGITIPNGTYGGVGIGFLILGYHSYQNIKTLIITIILSLLSLSFNVIISDETIPTIILNILCASFFYLLWYDLVIKPQKGKSSISRSLSPEENQILTLISQGYSQKCAGAEMGLTQSEASELIKKVKRKTGYESLYQIMALYGVPK